jgi:hypothetical protein
MKSGIRWLVRAGIAAALANAVVGCGGHTTGTGSEAAPIAVGDFPNAAAHAFCDGMRPCCGEAGVPFDLANCLKEVAAGFQMQIDSATTRRYVPAAGGACVAALRTEMTSCAGGTVQGHSCDRDLLVGTLPPGSPCGDAHDCLPPAMCSTTPDQSQRHCIATDAASEGEACTGDCAGAGGSTVGDCSAGPMTNDAGALASEHVAVCFTDQGLYCGTDETCHSMGKLGEPCTPGYGCVPGVTCDSHDTCARPVNSVRKPPFSACVSGDKCETHVCQNGKCLFELTDDCAHPFASQPAN